MRELRIHKDQRKQWLQAVDLFAGCTDREFRRIEALTTDYRVPARRVLTTTGEPGAEFFVIVSGTATVSRDGVVLGVVGPGSFFGELALLDGGCRTATIVADTDMHLLVLSQTEFRSLPFLVPSVAQKMLTELGRRLRRADELLTSAMEPVAESGSPPRLSELNSSRRWSGGSGGRQMRTALN